MEQIGAIIISHPANNNWLVISNKKSKTIMESGHSLIHHKNHELNNNIA